MKLLFNYAGSSCFWNGNFAVYNTWASAKKQACVKALVYSRNTAFRSFFGIKRIADEEGLLERRNDNVVNTIETLRAPSSAAIPTHVMELALQGIGVKQTDEGEIQCALCLDELGDPDELGMFKGCGHVFHHQCMQDLVNSDNRDVAGKCPNCRQKVNGADDIYRINKRARSEEGETEEPAQTRQRVN